MHKRTTDIQTCTKITYVTLFQWAASRDDELALAMTQTALRIAIWVSVARAGLVFAILSRLSRVKIYKVPKDVENRG